MAGQAGLDGDLGGLLRARQQRNFLTTLLLSQGVPMLLHGDELGRTKRGNNNTYAQDNDTSWSAWDAADWTLVEFVAALTRLRRDHPTFRRAWFFDGRPVPRGEGEPVPDVVWLSPSGAEMQPEVWDSGFGRTIGMFLNGNGIHSPDVRGQRIVDDNMLVCFNAHDGDVTFQLPGADYAASWDPLIDTAGALVNRGSIAPDAEFCLVARSVVVLVAHTDTPSTARSLTRSSPRRSSSSTRR